MATDIVWSEDSRTITVELEQTGPAGKSIKVYKQATQPDNPQLGDLWVRDA